MILKEGETTVTDKLSLFKGVQKYLVGAVIVGQSTAIISLAAYIGMIQKENKKDLHEMMQYIMEKNDKLEESLYTNRELNRIFVDKAEKATEVITRTTKPKPNKK